MIANPKALFFFVFLSASVFGQGSLTPPTGPAPSMKTLGQIEPRVAIDKAPFKISAPGSYYVTTNISAPVNTAVISISASNVSIDLGGFTISVPDASQAAIAVSAGADDITIQNGSIGASGSGIEASGATHVRVSSVRVSNCLDVGISTGANSVVTECSSSGNGSTGIRVGTGGSVVNCQTSGNQGNGIQGSDKSTIRNCTASNSSLAGITVGDYAKVMAATATDNDGNGINGGTGVQFIDCTANANKQSGINAGRFASVSRANTSANGQFGINLDNSATVNDCTATANANFGIHTGLAAHVANCKVDSNGGGIAVQRGSTVRDCSAQQNSSDGIVATDQCVVSRNNANLNSNLRTAAGLHVTGTDNVIQENIVTANDRGIALDTAGNLVVKNSATNNTLNFFTVGDQMMGPVATTLDASDVTNPFSNFIY